MPGALLLAPSILSADFACLREQIDQAQAAGADWIHIDVMDGHFVPTITMGPFIVETFRRLTDLPLDVHLMIERPERSLADYANAGANLITIHAEATPHAHAALQTIRRLGCQAGLAINPGTSAEVFAPLVEELDLALVMTVNPGASGQRFIPAMLPKIAAVRRLLTAAGSTARLEVDGGVSATTLPAARAAGADVFVAASAVFKHPAGIAAGITALRNLLPAVQAS